MSKPVPDKLPLLDITDVSNAIDAGTSKTEAEQITLHFSLELTTGELIDSTFDAEPARFRTGDGSLLPEFEAVVLGLEAGQKITVTLPPEKAFGLPDDANIRVYPHYQFPADMALEAGLLVAFNDSTGNEQAGVIRKLDRQQVTVDFNHPLAGKAIIFTAEVIERQKLD